MRPPLRIRLRGRQLTRLQQIYRQTRCPRTHSRVQMVLLSHDDYDVTEIAAITRQSDDTVRRWLQRFQQEGVNGLREAPHSGRPPEITPAVEAFLRDCILNRSPRDLRLAQPFWTTASLAQAVKRIFKIKVSAECIRQHLERVDLVCRRPTWTVKHLARQQPGYAQKKVH